MQYTQSPSPSDSPAAAAEPAAAAPTATRKRKSRGNAGGKVRFRRGRSPHPGVRVEAPRGTTKSRRHTLGIDADLRAFDQPDTMRGAKWVGPVPPGHDSIEVLDGVKFAGAIPVQHDANVQTRELYAALAWRTLTARRTAKGTAVNTAGYGKPIADTVHWQLTVRPLDENIGPTAVANARRYLKQFTTWLGADGRAITSWHECSSAVVAGYIKHIKSVPGPHNGRRKNSTLNQIVNPLRVLLRQAAKDELLPDDYSKYMGALERLTEDDVPIVCLNRAALQALYLACARVDALPERAGMPSAVVIVTFVLLTAMRRREYTSLRVSDVRLDQRTGDEVNSYLHVRKETSKTGARRLLCLPYSPLLVELLRALVAGRETRDSLLGITYDQVDPLFALIRANGPELMQELQHMDLPEEFSSKALRSTGCTYLVPIPVADPRLKADRCGHSMAVQEEYYRHKDVLECTSAPSLEVAMATEAQVRRAVELAKRRAA